MATNTMEARITIGKFASMPVKNKRHKAMAVDANTNDNGVLAPAVSFTADCDNPPATGYPWPNAVAALATPKASSSCRASISYPFFCANVFAAETLSI